MLFPAAVARGAARQRPALGQGADLRYRHRGGRHGREAHPRADSVLSPARARELPDRHRDGGRLRAVIRCTVSVHHKTGVEMEALTGASVAALTVYDMCKALVARHRHQRASPGGQGRRQERLPARGRAVTGPRQPRPAPVYGLMLAGGASSRMQRDKAALLYRGKSQLDRAVELASRHVSRVFVSVRAGQDADPARARRPLIVDSVAGDGPIVGIRSALAAHPKAAWLVLACDLPFLSDDGARASVGRTRPEARAPPRIAAPTTACPNRLCAMWEPKAAAEPRRIPGRGRQLSAQVSDAPRRENPRAPGPHRRSTTSTRRRNTHTPVGCSTAVPRPAPCSSKFSITP